MDIDLADLPDDVDTLHHMISDLVVARDQERAEAQAEIDRLQTFLKTLQRNQFGRRSERLDNDQLQLGLGDIDADIARAEAALPGARGKAERPPRRSKDRPSLPDHLERVEQNCDIETDVCVSKSAVRRTIMAIVAAALGCITIFTAPAGRTSIRN